MFKEGMLIVTHYAVHFPITIEWSVRLQDQYPAATPVYIAVPDRTECYKNSNKIIALICLLFFCSRKLKDLETVALMIKMKIKNRQK